LKCIIYGLKKSQGALLQVSSDIIVEETDAKNLPAGIK
jgi:hypothetical protein